MFENSLQACEEIFELISDETAAQAEELEEIKELLRGIRLSSYRTERTLLYMAAYFGVPISEIKSHIYIPAAQDSLKRKDVPKG